MATHIRLFALLSSALLSTPAWSQDLQPLPGHVLRALQKATQLPHTPEGDQEPLTISVTLRLSDPAGFEALHENFKNPDSPDYHRQLSAAEFSPRFGPGLEAYQAVRDYFEAYGFTLVTGTPTRRTLTIEGTRAQAESAFHVSIDDYQLGGRTFHAVANDSAVPAEIAALILGVGGLANLAQPHPGALPYPTPATPASIMAAYNAKLTPAGSTNSGGLPPGLDGSGQTIGIIAHDDYFDSDLTDWLAHAGLPASLIGQVTRVNLTGSTPANGCDPPGDSSACRGTNEVLLDIESVLGTAPGAKVFVYFTPVGTDLPTLYSLATEQLQLGGGGVLSTSWSLCEDESSSSDAATVDSILHEAALLGVTTFADTGDYQAGCQGYSFHPNNISLPSASTGAVAVGGTALNVGSGNTYLSESWWQNGTAGSGFGFSEYIFTPKGPRSVPDVSIDAAGVSGFTYCLTVGGKPTTCGVIAAGTSMATPFWAGIWALARQAQMDAVGSVDLPTVSGSLYKNPDAFHSPAGMTGPGNDAAHLGLGSPDVPVLISKTLAMMDGIAVESISPDVGPAGGGTTVTIHGKGFVGVKKVTFGGVDGAHLTIHSDSELTAESPATVAGAVDVQVVTPGATTAKDSSARFVYLPEVSSISPNIGPIDGGFTVTVTGEGFNAGSKFTFGGASATAVSCTGLTRCIMVAPAHAAGTVDVVLQLPTGDSPTRTVDHFTYQAPVITSFNPTVGPTIGGMTVGIFGTGLSDHMTVKFGSAAAATISCGVYPTGCGVTSPAGSPGPVHLTVTVGGVTSPPSAGEFTFAVFPTVTNVSPSRAIAPGKAVSITGTNFSTKPGGTTFHFGTQTAPSATCASTTQCSVVVPAPDPASAPVVAVSATVNGLTSLNAGSFTYGTNPVVKCQGTDCHY
jgi:hypothetical protein